MLQERDIFDEKQETKRATFSCPHCRESNEYEVRWLRRTKKRNIPKHLSHEDRIRVERSRNYMVRVDDVLACRNLRCRKRFDIPSSQTVVFI
jgi:hypothetical protein